MFEFYYPEIVYNEPSFWSSLIITLTGTFLGFWGAFYLVGIGQKRQRITDAEKKIDDFKDRLAYFSLLIDNSIKTIIKQIDNFEKLAKEIKKDPVEISLLPIVASTDLDRLQKIDTIEIFKAYSELIPESDDKLRDYMDIFSSIDYLSLRTKQGFDSNEKHIGFLHKDQLLIKEKIESLSNELIRQIKMFENTPEYNKNPDYKFLTTSHLKYRELLMNNAKLSQIEIDFLIPFGNELAQNHSQKSYFFNLYIYTSESIKQFTQIRINSLSFSDEFINIRKEMKEPIEKLKKINGKLKRAGTKNNNAFGVR